MSNLIAQINAILAQGLPGARLITQGKQFSKLSLPLRLPPDLCNSGTSRFCERRRAKMLTISFIVAPPPQVHTPNEIVQQNGANKIVFDYGLHGLSMEFGALDVKLTVPLAVPTEYCLLATQLLAVLGGMIEVEFTSMQALPVLPRQQPTVVSDFRPQALQTASSGGPHQYANSPRRGDESALNHRLDQFLSGLSITKPTHAIAVLTIPVLLNADDCQTNTNQLIKFLMSKNYPPLVVALLPSHPRQGQIGRGTMTPDGNCVNDMGLFGLNLCALDGIAQLTIPGRTTMETGRGLSEEVGLALAGFSTQILFVQRITS